MLLVLVIHGQIIAAKPSKCLKSKEILRQYPNDTWMSTRNNNRYYFKDSQTHCTAQSQVDISPNILMDNARQILSDSAPRTCRNSTWLTSGVHTPRTPRAHAITWIRSQLYQGSRTHRHSVIRILRDSALAVEIQYPKDTDSQYPFRRQHILQWWVSFYHYFWNIFRRQKHVLYLYLVEYWCLAGGSSFLL